MEELKTRIREAALKRFSLNGLSFTMQDVAKDLHISKKTIYVAYASKEELLLDMVNYAFISIHRGKQAILDSKDDVLTKLRKVIIALPDTYSALDLSQMEELNEKYPKVADCVRMHLNTGWEPTIQLLKEAEREGVIRKTSLPVVKAMITASIEAFLTDRKIYEEDGLTYTETLEEMISVILEGLVKRK